MTEFQEIAPSDVSSAAIRAANEGQRVVVPVVYTTEKQACLVDRLHVRGATIPRWKLPAAVISPELFASLDHSILAVLRSEAETLFGNSRHNRAVVDESLVTSLGLIGTAPPTEGSPAGACVLPYVVEFDYPEDDNRLKRRRDTATRNGASQWMPFHEAKSLLESVTSGLAPTPIALESLTVYDRFLTDFTEIEPSPGRSAEQMTLA